MAVYVTAISPVESIEAKYGTGGSPAVPTASGRPSRQRRTMPIATQQEKQ